MSNAIAPVAAVAHEVDALLLVDCVTSLGGCLVGLDEKAAGTGGGSPVDRLFLHQLLYRFL